MLLGILSFVTAGLIALYRKRPSVSSEQSIETYASRISITSAIPVILIVVGFLQVYVQYRLVLQTVVGLGYNHSSLAQTLYVYRIINTQGLIPDEYAISSVYSLLKYFVESSSALAIFVFLYNIFAVRQFQKKDILWIGVAMFWPINAIITTSRGDLLNIIAMAFYLMYFFLGFRRGFNQKTDVKVIKIGIQLLAVFFFVFLFISIQQGRVSNGFVSYISIYTNGGVRNFDLFIKDPVPYGQGLLGNDETLRYISLIVQRLSDAPYSTSLALEFRNINGVNTGNIYTAFRRYYSDFGFAGIILFSSFLGYFLTNLYCKAKLEVTKKKIGFTTLLFAWLSKPIFFLAIEDTFYVTVVTLNGLIRIFFLWMLYVIFIKKILRIRIRL